jgi:hypothetical protein
MACPIALFGKMKAFGKEPLSFDGLIFNFKLGCFVVIKYRLFNF